MNYPARGQMSEDGKFYTSKQGNVYELGRFHIEGAYVPSEEEQAACDMAREDLRTCNFHASIGCANCGDFVEKSCPTRRYLSAHGDAAAWEVTP